MYHKTTLMHTGTLSAMVGQSGVRWVVRRKHGNGLEVPCVYKFVGNEKLFQKMKSLTPLKCETNHALSKSSIEHTSPSCCSIDVRAPCRVDDLYLHIVPGCAHEQKAHSGSHLSPPFNTTLPLIILQ